MARLVLFFSRAIFAFFESLAPPLKIAVSVLCRHASAGVVYLRLFSVHNPSKHLQIDNFQVQSREVVSEMRTKNASSKNKNPETVRDRLQKFNIRIFPPLEF